MKEFKHKKYIQEDFNNSFEDNENDYSEIAAAPDNTARLQQYIPGSNCTYGMFYKIADKLKKLCYNTYHGDEGLWSMAGYNLEYATPDSQVYPFCVDKCDLYDLGFGCDEDENPCFDTLLLFYGEDGDEFDVLSVNPEHQPCQVFTAWDRILKALN